MGIGLEKFEFQPCLESGAVSLRPMTSGDFDSVQVVARDLQTWADYPTQSVRESGDLSSWFPDGVVAAKAILILHKETQQIAGTTRYYPVPNEPTGIGIGYTFLAAQARDGGRTNAEVKRMMFEHAFESFDDVWFHVLPENFRSQAAVKKLGVEAMGQQTLHLTDQPRVYECFRLSKARWAQQAS